MGILLVEDDLKIASLIKKGLTQAAHFNGVDILQLCGAEVEMISHAGAGNDVVVAAHASIAAKLFYHRRSLFLLPSHLCIQTV